MLLDEFKNLVDSLSSFAIPHDDYEVCRYLDIDTSKGFGRSQITNTLYHRISKALKQETDTEDKIPRKDFLVLQQELIYRHVLYSDNPISYLLVLRVIHDSTRQNGNSFPSFTDAKNWTDAITNCKIYNAFADTHKISLTELRNDYAKEFDKAVSAKQLAEKGCEIEIINSEIHIKNGLEKVVEELVEKIREVGGMVVIDFLFNHLLFKNKNYSQRFERYNIVRETSGLSFNHSPQIPFGFLLNLSVKFPFERKISNQTNVKLKEIIELSVVITNGGYGVQHYNFWEFHFQSGDTIIKFCTDIVLWDSMFSILQSRPSIAIEICDNLFSFVSDNAFQEFLGFTKAEFSLVHNLIVGLSSNVHQPAIIYVSEISKRLKQLGKGKIQRILDLLAHQAQANANYLLPSDYSSIDFGSKPLIKLGLTKFLLPNRSWSAPNYFEALATPLRQKLESVGRSLNNELGEQLEKFLKAKFEAKGISVCYGDYEVNGIHGECDLLVESEKAIIIIECKTKPLTRKSKAGIDIDLLIDLSDSVLSAQLQAGRTELLLRKNGSIALIAKDGMTFTIDLRDRHIERVALTQLEFGAFHDRTIIEQFLKSLLTHSFGTTSPDPKHVKKFEELSKRQMKWVEQYEKLSELDNTLARNLFFHCWFMSLPQLVEIINLSSGNDSFYEYLRKTQFVTMGTLNWYREFELATAISQ